MERGILNVPKFCSSRSLTPYDDCDAVLTVLNTVTKQLMHHKESTMVLFMDFSSKRKHILPKRKHGVLWIIDFLPAAHRGSVLFPQTLCEASCLPLQMWGRIIRIEMNVAKRAELIICIKQSQSHLKT